MARARNIKPSFFTNDKLSECQPLARLLFAGLWTIADREGRLEDRIKKIKAEILPYDACDCEALLHELEERAFIIRYSKNSIGYIQIVNFTKHQHPHLKETASIIPAPDEHGASMVQEPDEHGARTPLYPIPITLTPIPITSSSDDSKNDFQKIYDVGSNLFPRLASANTSAIQQWLANGCDALLDIIPEIERMKGKAITGWSYFTNGIASSKATRESPMPVGTAKQQYPQKKTETRKGSVTI